MSDGFLIEMTRAHGAKGNPLADIHCNPLGLYPRYAAGQCDEASTPARFGLRRIDGSLSTQPWADIAISGKPETSGDCVMLGRAWRGGKAHCASPHLSLIGRQPTSVAAFYLPHY